MPLPVTLFSHPYRRLLGVVVFCVAGLDQLSKGIVRVQIPLHRRVPAVPELLDIVHAENPGAAWGIMRNMENRMVVFMFITLAAFAVLLGWYRRLRPEQDLLAFALALLTGGALGNFIDRLLYRAVTDWIEFYVGGPLGDALLRSGWTNRWPAFNVADMAITTGTALFLYHVLVLEPRRERAAAAEGDA